MKDLRVLDPACTYAELAQRLQDWRVVSASANPILAGEPEYAVFERGQDERIHYTFNPVCLFRVVEIVLAPAAPKITQLPVVDALTIARWLDSADDRTVLRGVLATRVAPAPELLERVRGLREHPTSAIARAATQATDDLDRALGQVATRLSAAASHLLEQPLRTLLIALGNDIDGSASAALRPRAGDAALAFRAEFAAQAARAYEAIWRSAPRVSRAPPNFIVQCHLAPAGMLGEDNALSYRFPGGYRHIASMLQPERIWAHWKYLKPGQSAGQSYDGLVWLDDHWAWFPKPYRVLASGTHDQT